MTEIERDRLIRANKGKQRIKEYIEFLNSLLKLNIKEHDFLNLSKSDAINHNYLAQYKTVKRRMEKKFEAADTTLLDEALKNIDSFHCNEHVYLLGHESEYCGTLLLPYQLLLKNYKELIMYDEDSLNIFSENMNSGLMIDYFEDLDDHQNRKNFYEIVFW